MPAPVNFGRGHRFAAYPRCSADLVVGAMARRDVAGRSSGPATARRLPIWLAGGCIAALSVIPLWVVLIAIRVIVRAVRQGDEFQLGWGTAWLVAYACIPVLGLIGACGLVRMRRWGWWTSVVFLVAFATIFGADSVARGKVGGIYASILLPLAGLAPLLTEAIRQNVLSAGRPGAQRGRRTRG
jgi:hypothetical protein